MSVPAETERSERCITTPEALERFVAKYGDGDVTAGNPKFGGPEYDFTDEELQANWEAMRQKAAEVKSTPARSRPKPAAKKPAHAA